MIYRYQSFVPVVHPSAFVHPQACITGKVIIGPDVYIGPFAAIRGDWGGIIIEAGCNVQENCTIHMFPGITVTLQAGAHIGHGAIIHGAQIGRNTLIGMNAVVLDEAIIEEESIIGALTLVPAKMHIPKRSLAVGNPAKIIKSVSDDMLAWKTQGTQLYQSLPAQLKSNWETVEPLTEVPQHWAEQPTAYTTWKQSQQQG